MQKLPNWKINFHKRADNLLLLRQSLPNKKKLLLLIQWTSLKVLFLKYRLEHLRIKTSKSISTTIQILVERPKKANHKKLRSVFSAIIGRPIRSKNTCAIWV